MVEMIGQLRWQDGVDLGIITFLIYRLLQILRGSRAMQMVTGLAMIMAAFVLSRALGLFTLNWILDNFLGSIILVIIVIFQSDIRRALTRVGTAPLFSAERMVQRRDDIIEDVVQAAMALAEKRFGGLIVLQREVGLNEYMEIGTRLDARVSRELMESVFLPHSPIHDGALVIQKGRVTAVRCLLPLSTNPNLRKSWGTRHRAAIGVTEETDAVAIVISEQEGTVALVVGGNVTENIDGTRLRNALRELVAIMKYLWDKIVSLAGSNFGLKVLAIVIAVGLWVAGHRDVERAVEVPVEFRNIPSDLMVMDNRVDYVVLRLTGPRTLVSTLDAGDLKLGLDLDGAKPGSVSYPLAPSSFSIPRGVTVARITPPVVHLQLEPVIRRVLPVTVRFVNKPPAGQKIGETSVEPERVSVLGPAEEVRRLVSVETLPIDLEDNRSTIKRKVRLSTAWKAVFVLSGPGRGCDHVGGRGNQPGF